MEFTLLMSPLERRQARSKARIASTHPLLQHLGEKFYLEVSSFLKEKYEGKDYMLEWTCGYREPSEQIVLFNRGFSNAKPGMSLHNHGLALDFAIYDILGAKYNWFDHDDAFWGNIKATASKLDLEWGGNWARFIDKPHISLHFGFESEKDACIWLMTLEPMNLEDKWKRVDIEYERYIKRREERETK